MTMGQNLIIFINNLIRPTPKKQLKSLFLVLIACFLCLFGSAVGRALGSKVKLFYLHFFDVGSNPGQGNPFFALLWLEVGLLSMFSGLQGWSPVTSH